jgi:hypothetical protein
VTYQDQADLELVPELIRLARPEADAYLAMHRCAQRDDGRIPPEISRAHVDAVALTTQCPYCLDTHARNAKAEGCTAKPGPNRLSVLFVLAESRGRSVLVFLRARRRAAVLSGGSTVTHGLSAPTCRSRRLDVHASFIIEVSTLHTLRARASLSPMPAISLLPISGAIQSTPGSRSGVRGASRACRGWSAVHWLAVLRLPPSSRSASQRSPWT